MRRRMQPLVALALLVLGHLMPGHGALAQAASPRLPADLVWETNNDDPVFASPDAQRGGRFRTFITSFPLTLRLVGPDSNGGFAGFLRDNQLSLTNIHPDTLRPIPELATHWAFDADGRTVYYRLDPEARWSDGVPVTADDYVFALQFMRSPHIIAPWYNNHYTNVITDVVKYDDHTIAVVGANVKPRDELLYEYGFQPIPRHFHTLDENWVRDFNWQVQPATGAYQISRIRKGKYIEFTRVDNWWGDDKRYFRHRFNVEHVRVKVIRDLNIAYQYFSKGELDTFPLIMPQFWHRKATGKAYDKGWIGKITFYNDVPQPPAGLYLNEADPLLADVRVRYGIAHALNVDKVLRSVLRGDYERLQTQNEGYGDYTNRDIRARDFDLKKADAWFSAAGWQQRGPDGIRVKDGQRLSVKITYMQATHTPRLVVLKEEARKAGLELDLQLLDASAGFKQILEKKHQAAWMAWSGGGLSPRYWEFYHSVNAGQTQTNNITNTADPAMDRLIEAYRAATEKSVRVELAHQLEQMVYERGVFIPTYKVPYTREGFWRWIELPAFHATRTSQSLFNPFGSTGGLFWIDAEMKERVQTARRLNDAFPAIEIVDDRWRDGGAP